jgi:lipid II:glycine glycyltransferase (peptidoglycan interpeptide bridge formation enzyme)
MKFLDHLNPYDYRKLSVIDENWPLQFLSSFSRFHHFYHQSAVRIVYDSKLDAFIPIRFLNLKVFKPAQVLFAPVRNGDELSAQEQDEFYERLIWALYYNGHCERIVQPHPYSILAAVPPGSRYCEFGTYIVHLDSLSNEQILANFSSKYQKAVSHSVRNGAEVRIGRDTMEDFYSVYSSTMQRVNMAYESYEYFQVLHNYLGENHVASAVVYDNNEPVSGIFLIYSKYSAFLTHAGTTGESRLFGAAKLLNYEMMKFLKAKGVRRYDFVGVRLNNDNPALEGIFRFKKGFGGELKTGYLWKLDLMPMRARLYSALVRIRSKEKQVTDIIDQVSYSKAVGKDKWL